MALDADPSLRPTAADQAFQAPHLEHQIPRELLPFHNKVIVVTGGTRGIGEAIALRFAELGAHGLVIVGRPESEALGDQVTEKVRTLGTEALFVGADVAQPEAAEAVMQRAVSEFKNIHVLVNNAGISRDSNAATIKTEDWDAVMNTNARAALLFSREAFKAFPRDGQRRLGTIVNVASVVGERANRGQAAYGASKAAIINLTRTLALDWGSRGIRVNCVAPGYIDTDMTRRSNPQYLGATMDAIVALTPLGRAGKPQDVAKAVTFLASDDAAFITGTILDVNGGMQDPYAVQVFVNKSR